MQNDDDDLDEEGEEGDFGEWIDDEDSIMEISDQRKTKCLFSQRVYSNAHEAWTRAATDYGFDLRRVVSLNKKNTFIKSKEEEDEGEKPSRSGREEEEDDDDENELEFYYVIKVINFVRKMVLEETKNNS